MIREKAKEIMRSTAVFKATLCESFEKKAVIISACQKLISAADQSNPPKSTSKTIEPSKVYEAQYLPPVETERGGEEKRSENDENETRRPQRGRKQPAHPVIFSLLNEDVDNSQESTLPALLLTNEPQGPQKNLCFVNSPVQLLRHIPTFRFARFPWLTSSRIYL